MNTATTTNINSLLSRVEKELSLLRFGNNPKELYEPLRYTMSLGGKRIRPLFLLLGNDLFGGKTEDAISPALAMEIFHNFTLVHDDIMDNAPLRRNKPTVHKKWNSSTAILSGDVMFVWAYRLLAQCAQKKFPQILEVFNETAIKVCEGQQLDMNLEVLPIGEDLGGAYIEMISLKTAALIAGCLKTGAILGGANLEDANRLYDFGKNIGIAFQLQDDILDVFGTPKKFGKRIGGDIVANKKTFLLLKAFELADKKTKSNLNQLLSSGKTSAEKKVEEVKNIYNQLGIKGESEKEIKRFHTLALKQLSKINAAQNKIQNLAAFVNQLMGRDA